MSSNRPYPPKPDDPTVLDLRAAPEMRRPVQETGREDVESHAEHVEDKNLMRANRLYWITRMVYFVLGVLEVVMGLRFIFRLLGANQGSGFAMALYNLSYVFVSPFDGIFNDQTIGNVSVFEVSTLIAMVVYVLVAWGIVGLCKVILSPPLTSE